MIDGDTHINALRCDDVEANADARSAESAPLGIVTKNSSPVDFKGVFQGDFDPETGEIHQEKTYEDSRAERWALKSIVNRLLPKSRTSKCMVLRAPIPQVGLMPIEIRRSREHKRAFYHGLYTCGGVWTCPICNPKISERRKNELSEALKTALEQDLSVFLVTLTVPHGIGDDINDLLSRLQKALKTLSSGKYAIKTQLKTLFKLNLVGYVRTLEVTYGQNGFHPHYHILVFMEKPLDANGRPYQLSQSLVDYVYTEAWRRACKLSGLPTPSDEFGVKVEDGSKAAKYVTKWGLESEMTKTISKKGKRKGLTPWGLLRAILEDDDSVVSPSKAESLFRVYAEAFKNKRQLFWSVGLRKRLLPQNVELTDKELVDQEQDVTSDVLSGVTDSEWSQIYFYRKQPDVLNIAESDNPNSLRFFLDYLLSLPTKPKRGTGMGARGRDPTRGAGD